MSDAATPTAGWYADPENAAGERWWNGSAWSEHKRDATVGAVVPPPAPPVPEPVSPASAVPPIEPAPFTFGSSSMPTAASTDPYSPPATAPAYYGSPYAAAPYGSPTYGSTTNGLALAGLITSAAGWFIIPVLAPIAGIIISAFGLRTARQREAAGNPNSGRGLAMAGLIIGIVITSLTVIGLTIAIIGTIASYNATYR